ERGMVAGARARGPVLHRRRGPPRPGGSVPRPARRSARRADVRPGAQRDAARRRAGAARLPRAQRRGRALAGPPPPGVGAGAGWGARLAALERRAVDDSDCCVACTDEDAGLLRSLHGARDVIVAENGYDETALAPAGIEARQRARAALGIARDAYVAAFVGGDW